MKKIKCLFAAAALSVTLAFVPAQAVFAETTTQTAAATVKSGLVKEGKNYCYYQNGKKVKKAWKTVGKSRYYFNKNGNAVKNGSSKIGSYVYVFNSEGQLMRSSKASLKTVGNYTYYVDKKGRAATGWFQIGSRLYCASSKGRLYKNKTIDGITLTKNGYAKTNTASRLKKKTVAIVSRITSSSMSKSQKLRACWNYVVSGAGYNYAIIYVPNFNTKWVKSCALSMVTHNRGDCYSYACIFAALAREIGYDPYVIYGRVSGTRDGAADGLTRHGWVKINGAYYDPEGQAAGWFTGVYGAGSYDIRHQILHIYRFADEKMVA